MIIPQGNSTQTPPGWGLQRQEKSPISAQWRHCTLAPASSSVSKKPKWTYCNSEYILKCWIGCIKNQKVKLIIKCSCSIIFRFCHKWDEVLPIYYTYNTATLVLYSFHILKVSQSANIVLYSSVSTISQLTKSFTHTVYFTLYDNTVTQQNSLYSSCKGAKFSPNQLIKNLWW